MTQALPGEAETTLRATAVPRESTHRSVSSTSLSKGFPGFVTTTVLRDPSRLPALSGLLFDLDGVLTPTAEVHMRAWARLFSDYLRSRGDDRPYTEDDYFEHIDGKPRYDGVRDMLASRGIALPEGTPDDPPDLETVCGLGNRKNSVFAAELHENGVTPYPGSVAFLDRAIDEGYRVAVVSSSRNAVAVLAAAGLSDRFEHVVDGLVAAAAHLPGKPAPDTYLAGAERLGLTAQQCIVVEDAQSGVEAGRRGDFGLVIGVDRGVGAAALLDNGADFVVGDLGEIVDALDRQPGAGGVTPEPSPTPPQHRPPQHRSTPHDRHHRRSPRPQPVPRRRVVAGRDRVRARRPGRRRDGVRRRQRLPRLPWQPRRGPRGHSYGTFINGFHETWQIRHAEEAFGFARVGQTIVNVPDAKVIRLYVDDEPFVLAEADILAYTRRLDFRDGYLLREIEWRTPSGKRVLVKSRRLVSFTDRHLAVIDYEVTVLDADASVLISSQILNRQDLGDEYHAGMRAAATFDPRKAESFSERVLQPKIKKVLGTRYVLGYQATNSGMTVAVGAEHALETENEWQQSSQIDDDIAKHVYRIKAKAGQSVRFVKTITYHSSRGVPRANSPTAAIEPSTARARPRSKRSSTTSGPGSTTSGSAATSSSPGTRSCSRRSAGTSSSWRSRRRGPTAPVSPRRGSPAPATAATTSGTPRSTSCRSSATRRRTWPGTPCASATACSTPLATAPPS
ncbi:hypothetical protein GCM10025867_43990 [Frondihabitans sucicola]|uniref:Glycoside hydrolase family 65 N-terminal domain-containing protein n=1 Tax=Frondihabitans sucicola TaxID=1268041 RepID=A0ABN6Y864_9MICO|nr:hypothetical protein GCM10025867_43990 [Frondihabitans sucicola]